MSVLPEGEFGDRVRRRLESEKVIWLTTVGKDGTPQPNPVWFVWDGAESLLVYSAGKAARLAHLAARPNVSLNFNSSAGGGDIVVLIGTAARDDSRPPCHENPDYVAKYGSAMEEISGSREQFAAEYSAPVVVQITRIRGD